MRISNLCAIALSLTLLAPTLSAQAPTPGEPDAETLFQKGRAALFTGDFDEAARLLREAVKADKSGEKMSYRLNLARACLYSGKSEESEALLAGILERFPDHVEAGQLLAGIYAKQSQWARVVDVLKPLLQFRHDYQTHHYLAEATYNLDNYTEARKYYREAIRLNPNSPGDHYQLGNIDLSKGRFAQAAGSYEKALELGLDSAILHYKLASAYFNLRNYFGRAAVVSVPSGKPGTVSDGWYLIERVPGSVDQFRVAPEKTAIYQAAKAMDMGLEERADLKLLVSNIYLNARRYEQAYERYQQLKDSVPEEDRALYHYYLAQSALGVNKLDEYIDALKVAAELDKAAYGSIMVDAYLTVADRQNQAGNLSGYIDFLGRAVRESPETASLHMKLGQAYEDAKQHEKAVGQWRLVLALEPDHPRRTELLNLMQRHGQGSGEP